MKESAPSEAPRSTPAGRRTRKRRSAGDSALGAANPLLAVRLPAWRSRMLLFALFCAFVALAGRAFYLQGGLSTQFLQRQGEARYARTLNVAATRGAITDRNGVVLASSVPARGVWAIPDDVDASRRDLAQLAELLDLPSSELRRRLTAEDRGFVYLKRQVEPDVAKRIESFNLPGIHTSREFRRLYPEGAITAQLLAPVIGCLVYYQLTSLALSLGLAPSDLKLVTGLFVLGTIGWTLAGRGRARALAT